MPVLSADRALNLRYNNSIWHNPIMHADTNHVINWAEYRIKAWVLWGSNFMVLAYRGSRLIPAADRFDPRPPPFPTNNTDRLLRIFCKGIAVEYATNFLFRAADKSPHQTVMRVRSGRASIRNLSIIYTYCLSIIYASG